MTVPLLTSTAVEPYPGRCCPILVSWLRSFSLKTNDDYKRTFEIPKGIWCLPIHTLPPRRHPAMTRPEAPLPTSLHPLFETTKYRYAQKAVWKDEGASASHKEELSIMYRTHVEYNNHQARSLCTENKRLDRPRTEIYCKGFVHKPVVNNGEIISWWQNTHVVP